MCIFVSASDYALGLSLCCCVAGSSKEKEIKEPSKLSFTWLILLLLVDSF